MDHMTIPWEVQSSLREVVDFSRVNQRNGPLENCCSDIGDLSQCGKSPSISGVSTAVSIMLTRKKASRYTLASIWFSMSVLEILHHCTQCCKGELLARS
jgi:hypothetical protein